MVRRGGARNAKELELGLTWNVNELELTWYWFPRGLVSSLSLWSSCGEGNGDGGLFETDQN